MGNTFVSNLSKYRTELMGVATLWVLIYHVNLHFCRTVFYPFDIMGDGGVDIFFMLSSFGLYVGYKNYVITDFYKKRFLRIFPTYAILNFVFFSLKGTLTPLAYLLSVTGLAFYLSPIINYECFGWYVAAAYIEYLAFPFLMRIGKNCPIGGGKRTLSAFVIVVITICLVIYSQGSMLQLAVFRIPVLLLGMYLGYCYKNKIIKRFDRLIIIGFLFFVLEVYIRMSMPWMSIFVSWYSFILWLPFVFIAPFVCFIFILVMEYSPRFVSVFLKYVGSVSLEVYLIHVMIIKLLEDKYYDFVNSLAILPRAALLIGFIVIVILLSKFYHYLEMNIKNKLINIKSVI